MHNLKHLSTSKDNTPTPRTDAAVADGWSGDAFLVPYKFAQGLERENEELREQLSDWLKANGPGGWIDGLRKHNTHKTRVSPAEDFWMRLLADVNTEPCRWPGLRNELRDWQRAVRDGSTSEKASEQQPCRHGNATGHCQHCLDAL